MSTQTLTIAVTLSNLVFFVPPSYPDHNQPIQASSLDYGFDFDEEQLGRDLLAPPSTNLANQATDAIEADDFELLYRGFNS